MPACSVSRSRCRRMAWSAPLPCSSPCWSWFSSPSLPSAGKWPREWEPACLFSTSSLWRYRLDSSTDSWCVPSRQTTKTAVEKRSRLVIRKEVFIWVHYNSAPRNLDFLSGTSLECNIKRIQAFKVTWCKSYSFNRFEFFCCILSWDFLWKKSELKRKESFKWLQNNHWCLKQLKSSKKKNEILMHFLVVVRERKLFTFLYFSAQKSLNVWNLFKCKQCSFVFIFHIDWKFAVKCFKNLTLFFFNF